jgi:hypothetical protein
MEMRKMTIHAGMRVWISTPTSQAAAKDWPDGHPAIAIAVEGPRVTIADADNREITLPHYGLVAGFEFRESANDSWFPETAPAILDRLSATSSTRSRNLATRRRTRSPRHHRQPPRNPRPELSSMDRTCTAIVLIRRLDALPTRH